MSLLETSIEVQDFVRRCLVDKKDVPASHTGQWMLEMSRGEDYPVWERDFPSVSKRWLDGVEPVLRPEQIEEGYVVTYEGTRLVEWVPAKPGEARGGGGGDMTTRKAIERFTADSRRRMRRMLARIGRKHIPLFVTLTYPDTAPGRFGPEEMKEQLHRMVSNRIRRRWPEVVVVWRMEFTERGVMHFHLLLYNIRLQTKRTVLGREHNQTIFNWVRKNWWECSGRLQARWELAVTDVEPVFSTKKLGVYINKYMAKTEAGHEPVAGLEKCGRFWGVYNRRGYAELIKKKIWKITRDAWLETRKRAVSTWNNQSWVRRTWVVAGFQGVTMEVPSALRGWIVSTLEAGIIPAQARL